MSVFDCYGQQRAIFRLQRARRGRRVPHSYIFHGPQGVGKGLLARQWAKLLLCSSPTRRVVPSDQSTPSTILKLDEIDDCCDKCDDCRLVDAGTHPDLHIITRNLALYTKIKRKRQLINLPIDVIREFVIKPSGTSPSRGRARIFLIEEAQTMSRGAQNALLKTLEEPPRDTFLLLITSRYDLFLPTVRSRSQSVRFQSLPRQFVSDRLIEAGVQADQSSYLADFCDGRLGCALELAQTDLYEKRCRLVDMLSDLSYASALEVAGWLVEGAKAFAKSYTKLHPGHSQSDAMRLGQTYFFQMITHAFSTSLRQATGRENPEHHEGTSLLSRRFSPMVCSRAIRLTCHTEALLQTNVNPSLLFESLMLQLADYAESYN